MYRPAPTSVEDIKLPDELLQLTEEIAANVHDVWAEGRIREGWSYGPAKDAADKKTPLLVPYEQLPESEKEYDRSTALYAIRLAIKKGYSISRDHTETET